MAESYPKGYKTLWEKSFENTVGKAEIAHSKQFLLCHSDFKRLLLQTHKKQGLFRKGYHFRNNSEI